ncbi:MAG: PKD domain-containing protein, partial [Salibacteraceae bacterium]
MTKLKYIAYLFFPLILLNYGNAFPQCGDSIDLGTWVQEGIPANGNWTVTGGGNAVNQTINGEPTFYVSPDSFINVIITGDIRVATTGDDDWVGFVFGYNGPDTTDPANYDFYLFDWKQNDQNFGGFFGAEGYSLSRVNGPVVNLPEAFSANAGPFVDLIDSQYGNNEGWNDLQTYSFALTYTNTRAVIAIDGDTIFDVFGCFPPGRFGFYNYSQSDVEYSNFSYRVAAAFEVVTPDVCLGDSARFIALSDSCFNAAGVPLNNTLTGWFWDFGDGNTSTDTNGVHLYNAPGTYEVSLEVTDYLGCKDTAYSTVNVYDVSVDLGNDTSICIGDTVTLDADTNALTYNWSTGEITQTIEVTDSGSYSVIVVGGGGCSDTDTVVVSNIALPVVDLGNDTSICNNDTLVLYAGNPGAVFLWNDGSALDSLVLNDSGTYWVEVLYPSGCSNRDTAVITNYAQPVVSPPNPSYCYGDTISVSAAGANTYTWFPAVGISSTVGTVIEMFTLVDTLYSVIGIDTNGCTDTSIFTVDVLDLPTVSITGGDSICDGDSTELVLSFTGLPPFDVSYTLNGDTFYRNNITAFQDTFAVSDSGMYTPLSVSDGQCSNIGSDSTYVYLRPLPTLSFQSLNDSICFRDSIAISAMGADQYLWTPSAGLNDSAAQTVIASPSATTLYTANGTDQFGCSDTASFLLEVLPLPILQRAATPNPVCSMDTVTLGASGAQSYYWISSLSNDTLFGDTVFDDPINHVNYFLTGTDSFGCSDTLSINVMVDTLPVVSILPQDTVFCLNDSAQLSAFGANTYEWQPSTGLSDSVTANVMASPTSTSAYQVVGTDLNGCKGSDSVVVNIWDLPTVVSSAATDEICIGDTLTITASGAATYYWTPNYRIIDDSAANSMVYPEGDTSYVVFGTDSNGCENIDTFDVTVHPLPIIELSTLNDSICLYDSTTIVATGAVSYDWVSIPGLSAYNQALVSAFPVTTTSYEVLGTDINGCVSSNDTVIRVLQLPHIVAAPAVGAICVGESQPIRLPGNYSYVWSPTDSLVFDGNNNDTVVASPLDTTTYNILATDFFGCQSDTHYTLAVTPLPVITTSIDDSVICPGVPTTIHVTGNYSFEWSPIYYLNGVNSANPTVAPQNSRSYYVTATGPGDCQSFDTVDVAVWPTGPYSAGGDTVMCEGDTVQFGASGGVSYSWSPSIGLSNTSIPDPMCYSKANRFYYVEITDSNGCKSEEAVFITVNDLPFASAGNDKSICFGDSVWIGGDPSGSAGASFEWTPASGLDGVFKPNPNA